MSESLKRLWQESHDQTLRMQHAIDELKNPTTGQKRYVSQYWMESIHDYAGIDILQRFLENNEVGFINNRGENCELYLSRIGLGSYYHREKV